MLDFTNINVGNVVFNYTSLQWFLVIFCCLCIYSAFVNLYNICSKSYPRVEMLTKSKFVYRLLFSHIWSFWTAFLLFTQPLFHAFLWFVLVSNLIMLLLLFFILISLGSEYHPSFPIKVTMKAWVIVFSLFSDILVGLWTVVCFIQT